MKVMCNEAAYLLLLFVASRVCVSSVICMNCSLTWQIEDDAVDMWEQGSCGDSWNTRNSCKKVKNIDIQSECRTQTKNVDIEI